MTSRFGFLSDEERLAERGPAAAERVRRALARGGTAQLFRAAHLLTLALAQARRPAQAAEVGRSAVECGRRLADRPGQAGQLFHVLGLQVDLLRLEGSVGDPDVALAGLSGLDDLAAGRPAHVGDLTFDDAAVAAVLAAGHPLAEVAGTARVVGTCKILLRHGRTDELLAFAASRAEPTADGGPDPVASAGGAAGAGPDRSDGDDARSTGPGPAPALVLEVRPPCGRESPRPAAALGTGHAAEAPWLVCPLDLPTPDPATLPGLPPPQARLGFARAAHTAAVSPPRAARRLVRQLAEVRDLLNAGPWLSEVTPVRCLLSVAETAARLELEGIVRTLALEARVDAACAGDQLLAAEADALLKGLPRPDPESFGSGPAAGPHSLAAAAVEVLGRLDEWSRDC